MALSTDHTDIPLAIIGMACRLPEAENLEQYWRLIVEGRSAIAEVPAERFDQQLYFDPAKGVRGKSYSKLAALLGSREFDSERNPIDEQLRRSVDLMHLLMTGVAADALRHAGMDPFALRTRNTAVFIGNGGSSERLRETNYQAHLVEAIRMLNRAEGFAGLDPEVRAAVIDECIARIKQPTLPPGADARLLQCNMIAGTISKAFGLTGGWLALNSACASSLQAILMGARALQQGRSEMAIVGGASDIHSHTLVLFSAAQALSACGSRPFDVDADGLVMCEGYGALVMKTLERALADGDPIQAVIRGLGVATDGRGKSLWAPRKEGQIKAMRRAYRSGVELSQLQYIECHATATQLGDATELETLGEVLKPELEPGRRIPVTSVKANIGHALEAAGIAGVIKTVLCMQHQTIPPAININQLNPKIDWESAPFYVPTQAAPWTAPANGGPRRAAVNAFGIGGLNMHVVLDEFTESARKLVAPQKPQSAGRSAASVDDVSVAIVGMGCILPGGIGLAKFWETLLAGQDPKSTAAAERWTRDALADCNPRLDGMVGGFVSGFAYDWRKHKVPPKQVAEADPLQFMLLEAAEQALNDAGYDRKPLQRERCGVVVGTEVGGEFCDELEMGLRLPEMQKVVVDLLRTRGVTAEKAEKIKAEFATVLLRKWPSLVDETGSFTSSTLASRVTKTLDLAGGAVAVDGGSISALSALAICYDMLLSGDNDIMICAAGQRRMGASNFESLDRAGLLSDDVPHNLLDAKYGGVVPGEGVGVVVLKRLADARRDGDRIHAILRGMGMAHHHSPGEALRLAASRAFAQAAIDPAQVQLVELDTDERLTAGGDELRALAEAHAGAARRAPLAVGSATAQFGHLGGGGGITALVKASLEIENGTTVPNVGLQQASPVFNSVAQVAQPSTVASPLAGRRLGAVASWSKGLAGYVLVEHGSAVPNIASTERPAEAKRPAAAHYTNGAAATATPAVPLALAGAAPYTNGHAHPQWQICRLGAATLDGLTQHIDKAQRDLQAFWSTEASRPFAAADRFRLAVVADGAQTLARKLQLARGQIGSTAARQVLEQQGVFFHELSAPPPRVAFVFPGQGSQYAGMLRELVHDVPAARRALDEIDAALVRLGFPTFEQLAWPAAAGEPTQLGSDVWVTQVSMLAADAIVLAALADRGIQPDVVLGHSYGEFAALYAAGAWDLETTIRLTRARCQGIAAAASQDSGLLATDAQPPLIESLAAGISSELHIANYNAPDQSVVGGRRPHLDALARSLQSHSHQARILAVPAAFHTPLMAGASRLLEQALGGATTRSLRVPLASTVTNSLVGDAAEIRRNLAAQLTTPVRYAALIEQLASERPTVFVEVGPQQTLTRLNRRIVDGGAWSIASDNAKRPGLEPLLGVQALLECLGVHRPAAATVPSIPAQPSSLKQPVAPAPQPMQQSPNSRDIPHFDATERRRAKMRGAQASGPARGQNGHAAAPAPAAGHGPQNGSAPAMAQRAAAPAPKPAPAKPVSPAPVAKAVQAAAKPPVAPPAALPVTPQPAARAPVAAPAAPKPAATPAPAVAAAPAQRPAAPAAGATATAARPAQELEPFLVNFVVEQTGYPAEVVDLDADLEADLGIDSIKKAQLFGELQEFFDISGAANLSLDDFPTLRHVLNFLQAAGQSAAAPAVVVAPAIAAAPVVVPAAPPVAVAPAAPAAPAPSAPRGPAGEQLESFLVNFVVEQTGYPAEVVDLDADLEADLGIDSIKKAQLFGELQEHFDIAQRAGNLSLDDFPTLRHVLDFLASSGPASTAPAPAAPPPAPAAPVPAAATAPAEASAPAPAAGSTQKRGPDGAQLESFLVNFVVEQTGYPAEVVDLDADLEADLGIDSIKKAQLFGELQEYFDIGSQAGSLSLDDFPTLRHVLDFLSQAGSSASGSAAPAGPSHVSATVEPALAVAAAHNTDAPAPSAAAPAGDAAQLEIFLINFVVEQTGYPAEVVDLDADLEADLGIDSIKKAQLFGELQEHFDIAQQAGNLSLDDFPTLRHVLDFLRGAEPVSSVPVSSVPASSAPTSTLSTSSAPANNPPAAADTFPQVSSHGSAAEPAEAPCAQTPGASPLHLAGSPYELGWQQGQMLQGEIRRILRRYAEVSDDQLDELPGAHGRACPEQSLAADELDELQGLADAVEVPLGNVLAHHFAVANEWGPSCELAAGSALLALRQPLPLLGVLADATQPAIMTRVPARGLAHLAVAPIGTTALWGGLNSAGVAVVAHPEPATAGSTPAGRLPSALVRRLLESATDLDSAIALARTAGDMQPWTALVSHASSGRAARLRYVGGVLTEEPLNMAAQAQPAWLDPAHISQLPGAEDSAAYVLQIEPLNAEIRLAGPAGAEHVSALGTLPSGQPACLAAEAMGQGAAESFPALAADSVCQRFSFEMRDAPLAADVPAQPVWSGAAIVVGAGPTSDALIAGLQGAGVSVHAIGPETDTDAALAAVERICASSPAPHLFITTARDGAPIDFDDQDAWSRERQQSMALPFFVCQKWMQLAAASKWLDRCTLVATVAEDGDFGFARGAEMAQGGAPAGLLKGIFVEFAIMQNERNLRIKVVDAPADVPPLVLAADIFRELASGRLDYEVAFVAGRRLVPQAVERGPAAAGCPGIERGTTWIVTGGARGITAACALELGRRWGLKLHLIGSTPLVAIDPAWRTLDDQGQKQLKASVMIAARQQGRNAAAAWERTKKDIEIDGTMRAFAAAGVKAVYHPCDVSDRSALAGMLEEIRRADGPISGILHGAGLERSCRFDKKQRDTVLATIDIKVGGAANLMALTARDPIRHFVGFGSISGRLGGFGQTDYSLANEMLAKLVGAYRRRRPWVKALTVHWHAWGEIGMAARPELQEILTGSGSLSFLPPAEGIAHLVRELCAGVPEPEVMITERRHWAKFSAGLNAGQEPAPAAASPAQPAAAQAVELPPPLIRNLRTTETGWLADLPLNPTSDPFLVEHLLRGRPLLPVVVGLEALAETAAAASGLKAVGFRSVDMIDGLLFHSDQPVVARVRATRRDDGHFDCELTCDFRNRAGGLIKPDRLYLRATVVVAPQRPALVSPLPAMPAINTWREIAYPDHTQIYHGPPFRGVTAAYCYADPDGWSLISALPLADLTGPDRAERWTVPSVVLDSALYGCGLHLWARGGNVIALPRGIDQLDLGRPPRDGEQCILYCVCRSLAAERPCYDFELVGDDGATLLQARGYYKVSFGKGDAL